jgi:SAM-dependent methyltransferase
MNALPTREALAFLERFLPQPPARLLQIGAGDGETALALARRGYAVAALEEGLATEARRSEVEWIAMELSHFEADTRFDAVVFTGTLHALQPVGRALDRAVDLLAPGGLVLAEELAFDRVNVHTARWFYDLESVLVAAEIIEPPSSDHAAERRPLARWRLEHALDPPLASGHDMLAAARERLDLSAVEEAPSLYRRFAERVRNGPRAGPRAARVLEVVFELESRLVRERDIAAAGPRFVGKPLL